MSEETGSQDGIGFRELEEFFTSGRLGETLYSLDKEIEDSEKAVRFELAEDSYAELVARNDVPNGSKVTLYMTVGMDELAEMAPDSQFASLADTDAEAYRFVDNEMILYIVPDEGHEEVHDIESGYEHVDVGIPTTEAYQSEYEEKIGGRSFGEYDVNLDL